jgi:hypothetical protein
MRMRRELLCKVPFVGDSMLEADRGSPSRNICSEIKQWIIEVLGSCKGTYPEEHNFISSI